MSAGLFGKLMPNNNKVFFGLFNTAANNALEMASLLYHSVTSAESDGKTNFNHISRLKEKGGSIKREMYAVSGQALISPFSRDDMYALSSALNAVSDFIDIASRRINFYNITINTPIRKLASIIVDCCTELVKVVEELKDISQTDLITSYCDKIKKLEHFADQTYNKALAALIEKETDPLEVLKYSEIFAVLEKATDKCELAVNVIEAVIVKNS